MNTLFPEANPLSIRQIDHARQIHLSDRMPYGGTRFALFVDDNRYYIGMMRVLLGEKFWDIRILSIRDFKRLRAADPRPYSYSVLSGMFHDDAARIY